MVRPDQQVKAAAAAGRARVVKIPPPEVVALEVVLHPAAAAGAQGQGLLALLVKPAQAAQ